VVTLGKLDPCIVSGGYGKDYDHVGDFMSEIGFKVRIKSPFLCSFLFYEQCEQLADSNVYSFTTK
jgi:hypothetical protein